MKWYRDEEGFTTCEGSLGFRYKRDSKGVGIWIDSLGANRFFTRVDDTKTARERIVERLEHWSSEVAKYEKAAQDVELPDYKQLAADMFGVDYDLVTHEQFRDAKVASWGLKWAGGKP